MFTGPDVEIPASAPGDVRIGHLLGRADDPLCVLVGFPVDEGVRRNGGRPGAAAGPDALRSQLYRMTPDPRSGHFTALLRRTRDLGNLNPTGNLEEDQDRLGRVLAPYLASGVVPIVWGGGHETAYGHFLGYVRAEMRPEILNLDAHPDVRPLRDGLGHSGSPFRQAIEHPSGACRRYTVAGLQPHAVSSDHLQFLERNGAGVHWADGLSGSAVDALVKRLAGPAMASIDLDVLQQAWAPGVSAPGAAGSGPDLIGRAARALGSRPAVTSIDVVELNPRHDENGDTARLAAWIVWKFLEGLSARLRPGDL